MTETWERIKRWRWRPERTVADQFQFLANRSDLHRIADTYDRLAELRCD
jgi:hypothetical protein